MTKAVAVVTVFSGEKEIAKGSVARAHSTDCIHQSFSLGGCKSRDFCIDLVTWLSGKRIAI